MELSRVARLLRTRWALVAIATLAGVTAAMLVTDWWNRQIEPYYRATAPVTYLGSDEARLQSALALALEVNAGPLAANDDASIELEGTGRLLFRGTGSTTEAAKQVALVMRQTFNQSDPTTEEPLIRARLDEIVLELDTLQSPGITPVEGNSPGFEDDILLAQIEALRRRLAELAVQLALLGPDQESQASRPIIEAELERVGGQIVELESRLASLFVPTDANREEQLQEGALESYRQQLIAEYQSLYLRLLGRNPTTRDDVVTITDLTPAKKPFVLTGLLGATAGALLAIAALVVSDLVRRPVWSRAEIDPIVPSWVELPPRRRGRRSSLPWYPHAPSGSRKRGVQVLRAGIDRAIEGESVSIGIADLGVGSEQIATLTADLGAALAASGRNILIIDADFEHGTRIPDFGAGGTQLAGILMHRAGDDEELLAFIKRVIGDQPEVLPGLRVLPAGKLAGDTVDALAGRHFTMLLNEAGPGFDAVLVTVPPVGHPAAEGLSQRLDYMLLVARAGLTPIARLEQADRDLRSRRSVLLGAVLLVGRPVRAKRVKFDAKSKSNRIREGPSSARHLPPSGPPRNPARSRRKRRPAQTENTETGGGDRGEAGWAGPSRGP